jgi:2-oxoisovalerate dehydrogenase E1 component beta subunit
LPECTLIDAIHLALEEALVQDENVVLIGSDIGSRGGIFGASRGFYRKFGPQRVIDSPSTADTLVGMAIGMALYGFRPICEIQFADFIHPAFNQIVNEAARIYYRSNSEYNVPLVLRIPYGGGMGAGLYHSQSIEAFFAHVPGLKVVIPSTPYDARGLLAAAICDPNPVIFLEPKRGYRRLSGQVPEAAYTIPLGKSRIARSGKNLSVFAYGMSLIDSLEAAQQVAELGVDAEVIDVRSISPLDSHTILASVRKTGRALIVHEDNLTGGFGAEIAALIVEHAFDALDAPVRRLAGPDIPAVPFSPPLQDWFMLKPEKIAAAMLALTHY